MGFQEDAEWNEEEGEILWSGLREVIMFKSQIPRIKHGLQKVSGDVARRIVYKAVYDYTKNTIDNLLSGKLTGLVKKIGPFDRKMAERILSILPQYGYGTGELLKWDPPEEVVVAVENSFEVDYYEENSLNPERPVCDFLRGAFAAAVASIADEEMRAEETKCRALGDDHCEFHITPKE